MLKFILISLIILLPPAQASEEFHLMGQQQLSKSIGFIAHGVDRGHLRKDFEIMHDNLASLSIEACDLTPDDLDYIATMPRLKTLSLGAVNSISDFSSLAKIKTLEELTLSRLTHLNALQLGTLFSSLKKLEKVNIYSCQGLSGTDIQKFSRKYRLQFEIVYDGNLKKQGS